jgi:NAD(P)-dependent dehydrogenase (short-subunit alcohol dehydrogenase family)
MPDGPAAQRWTLADAPALSGRTAIVTGATGGIGFEVARGLAGRGAETVLAGRNEAKGARAVAAIRASHPDARVRFELLDLGSLDSVAGFAARCMGPLDILVNNAGVMGLEARQTTRDGLERQIGVNYLAHFALTGRMLHALNTASGGGRVVNVASLVHRRAALRLDDLQSLKRYRPMAAYGQSKLAMLMFSLELHRRAQAHGWTLHAFAAHPGWARTDIIANGPGAGPSRLKARAAEFLFGLAAQSAAAGALPILYAATAPQAQPGGYYGPARLGETRGDPAPSVIYPQAAHTLAAARLWTLSEELTGVSFG